MNALKTLLVLYRHPPAAHFVRRLVCRVTHHSNRPLKPDRDELWLLGDRRETSEIQICKRCLKVQRRMLHGKTVES